MPKGGFKSITVSEEVYNYFFDIFELNKADLATQGINSFSAYVSKTLEQAREKTKLNMRFEVLLTSKDRVIIQDTWQNRVIEIDRTRGLYGYCYLCKRDSCMHCGFAVSLPQFYKPVASNSALR